jgi:cytochrome c-type biogenesis protein CcmH
MNLWRPIRFVLLTVSLTVMLGAGGDQARFNDLGHKMICMCGCNQILLECNHVGCTLSDKMREQLVAGFNRGDSDDLIQQSFVQEYGLTVLAAPVNTGFGRVAWITPFLVLIAALGSAVLVIRKWRLRPAKVEDRRTSMLTPQELRDYREQARRETEL